MVKKSKEIALILFFISIYFIGCANQLPPGGGPQDKIPPEIIETYPINRTVNYDDKYIEFTFSEYVDKRSFKEAVFISPSIDGDLDISWTNKTVTIGFPKELKEEITYTVTIGTDVVDYNNKNRMAESYGLVFSTGEKIDNGSISGIVYAEKTSGIMLFAYVTENHDTINPAKVKPDYVTQAGEFGTYKFTGLAKGSYRIFAVKDEYKDFLFQSDQDLIGVPKKDVVLTEQDSSYNDFNFIVTKIDTVKPRLFSALMTDRNHILLNFSEEIDLSVHNVKQFQLIDSTENKEIPVLYLYKGRTKNNEAVISLADSINPINKAFITVSDLTDLKGNVLDYDYVEVTLNDKIDTSAVSIITMKPANASREVDFLNTQIFFSFDDGFSLESFSQRIQFSDTAKKPIKFELIKVDDASFYIKSLQPLKPQQNYRITFNLKYCKDAAGNYVDSVFAYEFKTLNGLDFTGLTGTVKKVDFARNPVLRLENIGDKNKFYEINLKTEKFSFERILPDKYRLFCYYDENNDGKYSFGFPYEFIPSEEFAIFTGDIILPPRWAVTDLEFVFQ